MADVTPRGRLPLIADHIGFVVRHRLALGVLVTAGMLAGVGLSAQQHAEFSATASLELTPVPMYVTVPSELLAPRVSLDTDAQLLHSPEVVHAVASQLRVEDSEAPAHMRVTASANTSVLHVTVTSRSPQQAADAANVAVETLTDVRRKSLGALQDSQIREVRILLTEQEDTLSRRQNRRLVVPETDETFNEVVALRGALDELEQARRTPARVVRPAVEPVRSDYANTEVPVASGPMIGLLLGCLFGTARDRVSLRRPLPTSQTTFGRPASPVAP